MSKEHKKVIYSSFFGDRQFIVDYLYKNHNWEPVLFTGDKNDYNWAEEKYPDSIIVDFMELRQAKFDYSKIREPIPIDYDIISKLSKYEPNLQNTIEDTDGFNYSYHERKSYYYDILKYWNTVINYFNPNIIIFFNWPHTADCYSLYMLAKYFFSIDILFWDPFPLLNEKYHHIGYTIEDLYLPFIKIYNSDVKLVPSLEVKKFLNQLRSRKGATSDYENDWVENIKKASKKGFRWKVFIILIIKTLTKGTGFKKMAVAWKKNKKPYYLPNSRLNALEYFFFVEKLREKNKKLLKYYKPLCVEPDFEKNFIYFASSYQPEAVTESNAGVFQNIFLILDILSAIIPNDWVIYYKENPITFASAPWTRGALRRNKYYYQRVNAYKNIQLVSSEINTFTLIDNSRAVATLAGSVAWEGALRGKPALSFGSAWYMGCKSIFRVKTLQDGREAINKILNGFTPNQVDLESYAAAIESITVKTEINSKYPKKEMEDIAAGFYEAHKRYYGSE